ncbi:MAG: hypothetical protein ACPLQP_03050 [Moorellaceae bacterium]
MPGLPLRHQRKIPEGEQAFAVTQALSVAKGEGRQLRQPAGPELTPGMTRQGACLAYLQF